MYQKLIIRCTSVRYRWISVHEQSSVQWRLWDEIIWNSYPCGAFLKIGKLRCRFPIKKRELQCSSLRFKTKLSQLFRISNRKHIHITSSVFRSLYSWHAWCSTSTFYLIFYENGSRCYRNERPFHKLHILPWFCTSLHILSWWCRTCPHILQVKPV